MAVPTVSRRSLRLASACRANGDTNYELTPGTYAASGAGESAVDLASIFAGETTQGDWTFTISDNNGGETGSFTRTSIAFTSVAVPEPGAMATIVLGTLFGGVYFRKRQQKSA